MLEILGSNYQTTDKGQHIAPKVDAKIKRLVLQKSSQENYICPIVKCSTVYTSMVHASILFHSTVCGMQVGIVYAYEAYGVSYFFLSLS